MSTVENNVCDKIKTFNWIVAPPPKKKERENKDMHVDLL